MAAAAHEPLEGLDFSNLEPVVRLHRDQGVVVVLLNGHPVSTYDESDKGAKRVAAVSLAEAGVAPAKVIAEAFGLTPAYLSRLRGRYRRHGARGIVGTRTGPKKAWRVTPEVAARIRELHEQGWTQKRIEAEVGVSQGSVSRVLNSPAPPKQQDLFGAELAEAEGAATAPASSVSGEEVGLAGAASDGPGEAATEERVVVADERDSEPVEEPAASEAPVGPAAEETPVESGPGSGEPEPVEEPAASEAPVAPAAEETAVEAGPGPGEPEPAVESAGAASEALVAPAAKETAVEAGPGPGEPEPAVESAGAASEAPVGPAAEETPVEAGPGPGEPEPAEEPAGATSSEAGDARSLPSEPRTVVGAGVMLLHSILSALGLVRAFEAAGARLGAWRRFDLKGIVTVLALGFGLGLRNVERMKLAQRADLGLVAGLPVAPDVRTIRRKLDELANTTDPVVLSRELARSLIAFEPVWDCVYFVDGHFAEYTGKLPVPKSWHPRRKKAARGRTDTYVHDVKGRPLFCVSSEINEGLTKMMPRVVDEILAVAGENADVQLFFDRGGFSQELFADLTRKNVGFTTWVKGTPANYEPPAPEEFQKRWYAFEGKRHYFELAEGELELGDYIYRLIVLRDKGRLVSIVTNNWTDPAPKLVLVLKLRWRQENSFKDLVENLWVDGIVEYGGEEESDPTVIRNPRRIELRQALAKVRQERTEWEAVLGRASAEGEGAQEEEEPSAAEALEKRAELMEREQELERELESTPARLPRNEVDPEAVRAILRTGKRTLVKGIKNAVHNAEHWLARRFLTHFGDPDEYRTVLRSLFQQSGTLHYRAETGQVTVRLVAPDTPRVARALGGLLEELNGSNPRTLDGRWAIHYELDRPVES